MLAEQEPEASGTSGRKRRSRGNGELPFFREAFALIFGEFTKVALGRGQGARHSWKGFHPQTEAKGPREADGGTWR